MRTFLSARCPSCVLSGAPFRLSCSLTSVSNCPGAGAYLLDTFFHDFVLQTDPHISGRGYLRNFSRHFSRVLMRLPAAASAALQPRTEMSDAYHWYTYICFTCLYRPTCKSYIWFGTFHEIYSVFMHSLAVKRFD